MKFRPGLSGQVKGTRFYVNRRSRAPVNYSTIGGKRGSVVDKRQLGDHDHRAVFRHVDVECSKSLLLEAVAETEAELEVVCRVAGSRRGAEEDSGSRVADADDCV